MKRVQLDVTKAMEDYAQQCGAYFDEHDGAWYVDGDVPIELEELVAGRHWRPHHAGFNQAADLAVSGLLHDDRQPRAKTPIPTDLLARVTAITRQVEALLGNRREAMHWLETPRLRFGHVSALLAMTSLDGCDLVEKLLLESFEHKLQPAKHDGQAKQK